MEENKGNNKKSLKVIFENSRELNKTKICLSEKIDKIDTSLARPKDKKRDHTNDQYKE